MNSLRTIRKSIFVGAAAISRVTPPFRGKYRAMNALYHMCADQRAGTVVGTLSKPTKYDCKLNLDCAHERLAYCENGYESDTVIFLQRLWDGKGYFMDIGANIGLISVPFSLLAKASGKLPDQTLTISFEPVASNFAALTYNLEVNGLGSCTKAFNAGAAAVAGQVEIQVEGDQLENAGTGTANILPTGSDYECERQTIKVVRIDDLVASQKIPENCSLIKIDTDGYDLFALQGARELLTRNRPIVFGEFAEHCMNWHNHSIRDVQEFARDLDYILLIRTSQKNVWQFQAMTEFSHFVQDALLVPSEKLDSCRWCLLT